MGRESRPTIADVARRAGVSTASVSRYLNGMVGNLSQLTAVRIKSAIQEMDYRPNAWARSLKTQRSGLVAAVVTDLKNDYVTALLEGIETTVCRWGMSLLVGNTRHDREEEERLLTKLIDQRVEGIVLQPTSTLMSSALRKVIEHEIRVVLVDRVLDDYDLPMVGLDNTSAIGLAFDHLWNCGYRQVIYVTEPVEDASSRREREYAVMERASTWPFVKTLAFRNHDAQAVQHALQAYIEEFPSGSAVLCSNSVTAIAVIQAFSALRISAPDVGLITIDDPEWAPFVLGGVTTIRQPTEELGKLAAEMSLRPDEPSGQVRLSAQIRARSSTMWKLVEGGEA